MKRYKAVPFTGPGLIGFCAKHKTLWHSCRLFSFLILLGCTISCSSDIPPEEALKGKWRLTSAEAFLDESAADPLSQKKAYNDQILYFDFGSYGLFTTNTDLGLNKLLLSGASPVPGTYAHDVSNDRLFVTISVMDPQLNSLITLYFEVLDYKSKKPRLFMSKENYLKSLRNSARNMAVPISTSLNTFANRINQAWFSLEFEKL